jgi:hypothetical protein
MSADAEATVVALLDAGEGPAEGEQFWVVDDSNHWHWSRDEQIRRAFQAVDFSEVQP